MNLYYNLYCAKTRWPILNADNWKLGWNSCAEAPLDVITSANVILNLRKTPSNSSAGAAAPRVFELELLV